MGPGCSSPAGTVGPLLNGYHSDSDDGQLQPATTDVPPAPEAIVEMVRCQCKGNCSSNHCSCKWRTCHARTYVFATHSAKMTLTRITTIANQMMIVTV